MKIKYAGKSILFTISENSLFHHHYIHTDLTLVLELWKANPLLRLPNHPYALW
jgi:hypothetical protein